MFLLLQLIPVAHACSCAELSDAVVFPVDGALAVPLNVRPLVRLGLQSCLELRAAAALPRQLDAYFRTPARAEIPRRDFAVLAIGRMVSP